MSLKTQNYWESSTESATLQKLAVFCSPLISDQVQSLSWNAMEPWWQTLDRKSPTCFLKILKPSSYSRRLIAQVFLSVILLNTYAIALAILEVSSNLSNLSLRLMAIAN